MEIFAKIPELKVRLAAYRSKNLRIGFVPTMGALHTGHMALIERCRSECDIAICSVFVNPLQFNNKEDFVHYPITQEKDIRMLEQHACDVLFIPDEKEIYPEQADENYDFGMLEKVMEGKFRPGHFNGVAIVVKRLFDIVEPHRAYFGEKDYQQMLIIRRMTEQCGLKVEIVPCPTVREADGLAMSSRNVRLTPEQRALAPAISRILGEVAERAGKMSPDDLVKYAGQRFADAGEMSLEYFELADAITMEPVTAWTKGREVVACVAAYLGKVRLIDNIRFIS